MGCGVKPVLSTRQAEVAALVARGHPDKIIARETGLSIKTVQVHIQNAAAKIPGATSPRHKLVLWFFNITED
jgi:DNA-binding NarL/FixJ family response regulator